MNNIISSKEKATKLRKQGKSYNEINKCLGVSKSTLSTWLKDLPLSQQIKERNIKNAKIIWANNIVQYNRLRAEKYKQSEEELLNKFSNQIKQVNKNSLFWLGLGLFMAEGGKREKWSVRFTNSDPDIIKIIMKFFRQTCSVNDAKFRLRVAIHPNISDEKAKKYWSKLVQISTTQFYRSQTTLSKASRGKRKINQLPFGTLQIYIGDTLLRKQIRGWVKGTILKI